MFSYRHAFHAGNHADVLKHTALLAVLRHLTLKDTAIHFFDTHAGAGLYRLDGDYAQTSGEAAHGFLQLQAALTPDTVLAPALQDYMDMVASFNPGSSHAIYPGSPFIVQRCLRERDRLRLFELHPTDAKTLKANVAQLDAGRFITVMQEDGFEGLKKFLPPPSRRAFVLCDPSYEIKSDYGRVVDLLTDALKRFATGTYMVWYPIIPRPEAHELPRKLKTLANREGRPWLNATLTVKSSKLTTDDAGETVRPGLPASGVFVINPPHTLKATLHDALKQAAQLLAQGKNKAFEVETGG
ncbi:MAG: 23S rRNA (adenine(2030)-N(6))-methyltransferase RlmJ [Rhodoferax sp.]|nr:23S rRNA (adenine(2030)-N(6))-methyltransferase RlmJ [Betaproteobacteria bacterium]NCN97233.1 23S rRNA (adenine(2030)-N(6))-methyltransferase RlmJ [Rhodoferax sp.]OIP21101.1 MAG: 23S rRNA (adenine(2030)-N(6))-methyltransferase RlmJ [Comamonadaceae bacterium CG2_30_57_122]PIZ22817.1 MAG: 23S rRNA (adenine(2030)-N(6))-methyltransferase RlmJ [Comamonadaceae bacterium CG_4_10_14_0_8_um_filter_57_29]PJC15914.1 MAG: 23S rRNA (adenine(2030)-N(6))-methyltransferase RlmJ [Comamonadaceae bacterium CG_